MQVIRRSVHYITRNVFRVKLPSWLSFLFVLINSFIFDRQRGENFSQFYSNEEKNCDQPNQFRSLLDDFDEVHFAHVINKSLLNFVLFICIGNIVILNIF